MKGKKSVSLGKRAAELGKDVWKWKVWVGLKSGAEYNDLFYVTLGNYAYFFWKFGKKSMNVDGC
jgi:hypothetical protein